MLDFIVDFFTNLNAKKITGALVIFAGLWTSSWGMSRTTAEQAVFFVMIGITISGIGFVLIYYDMAKDKYSSNTNELEALKTVHDYKSPKKQNQDAWHINDHNGPKNS